MQQNKHDSDTQSPNLYRYSYSNSEYSHSINMSRSLEDTLGDPNSQRGNQSNRLQSFNNLESISENNRSFMVCFFQAVEIERLTACFDELSAKKQNIQTKHAQQIYNSQQHIKELTSIIESLRASTKQGSSKNNTTKQLQQKYQKSLEQISSLYDENNELQQKLTKMHEQTAYLSQKLDEMEHSTFHQKFEQFQNSKLISMEQKLKQMSKSNNRQSQIINEKKEEIRRLKDSLDVATKEKNAYLHQSNQLAWEVTQLKELQKQNIEYQNKIVLLSHELQRVNRLKNQKNKEIQNNLNLIRSKNEEITQLNAHISSLKQSLSAEQQSISQHFQQLLASSKQQQNDTISKLTQYQQEQITTLQQQNEKKYRQNRELSDELNNLQKNMRLIERQYENIKNQAEELRNSVKQKQRDQSVSRNQLMECQQQLRQFHHINQQMKQQNEQLRHQMHNQRQILSKEINNLQQTNIKFEAQWKNKDSQKSHEYEQIVQHYEQKIAKLHSQAQELRSLHTIDKQRALHRYELDMQTIRRDCSDSLRKVEQQSAYYKGELQKMQNQNIRIRGQLQFVITQSNNAQKLLQEQTSNKQQQLFSMMELNNNQMQNRLKRLQNEMASLHNTINFQQQKCKRNKQQLLNFENMIVQQYKKEQLRNKNQLLVKEEQIRNCQIEIEKLRNNQRQILRMRQNLENQLVNAQNTIIELNQVKQKIARQWEIKCQQLWNKLEQCEKVLAQEYRQAEIFKQKLEELTRTNQHLHAQQQSNRNLIQQIQQKLHEKSTIIKNLQNEIQQINSVIHSKEQRNIQLEQQLDIRNRNIEEMDRKLHEFQRILQLNSHHFQLEAEKASREITKLRNQRQANEQQNLIIKNKFESEISALKSEINGNQGLISNLQNDNRRFINELTQLKKSLNLSEQQSQRINHTIQALEAITNQKIEAGERKIEQQQRQNEQLIHQLKLREKQINSLRTLVRKTEDERENFEITLRDIQSHYNKVKSELQKAQAELQKQLNEHYKKDQLISRLEEEISIKKNSLDHKENEYNHEVTSLEAELRRLRDNQSQLSYNLEHLNKEKRELIEQLQQYNNTIRKIQDENYKKLQQYKEQRKNIIKGHQQQNKIKTSQFSQLQQMLHNVQNYNKKLETENQIIKDSHKQLQIQIKESQHRDKLRIETIQRLEINQEESDTRTKRMQRQLQELWGRNKQYQGVIGQHEIRMRQYQYKIEQYGYKFKDQQARNKNHENIIRDYENRIKDEQNKQRDYEYRLRDSQNKLRNYQNQIKNNENKLRDCQNRFKELQIHSRVTIQKLEHKYTLLEQQYHEQTQTYNSRLQSNSQQQEHEYSLLANKINSLLQASEDQYNKLYQYLDKYMGANSQQQSLMVDQLHDMRRQDTKQRISREQKQIQNQNSLEQIKYLLLQVKNTITHSNKQLLEIAYDISGKSDRLILDTAAVDSSTRQISQHLYREQQSTIIRNNHNRELQKRIDQLELSIRAITQDFQAKQHQYELALQDSQNRYEQISIKIERLVIQKEELRKQGLTQKQQNQRQQYIINTQQHKICELQKINRVQSQQESKSYRYEQKIALLSQEVERLQQIAAAKDSVISSLKLDIESTSGTYDKQLEIELKEAKSRQQKLQLKNRELQQTLQTLTNKLLTIKQQIQSSSIFTSSQQKSIDRIEARLNTVQKQLQTLDKFPVHNFELTQKIQRQQKQNLQLRKQNYELRMQSEYFQFMNKKINNLNGEIHRLQKLNISLKEEIMEARLYCVEGDALSRKIQELLAIMVLQSIEIEALRDQLGTINQIQKSQIKSQIQEIKNSRSFYRNNNLNQSDNKRSRQKSNQKKNMSKNKRLIQDLNINSLNRSGSNHKIYQSRQSPINFDHFHKNMDFYQAKNSQNLNSTETIGVHNSPINKNHQIRAERANQTQRKNIFSQDGGYLRPTFYY